MTRGRPAIKPTIPLVLWVMVELMRDRKEWGRARASARDASARVANHLAECFQGGRVLTTETVRDHYKRFERAMRRSNSGAEAELAKGLLDLARKRRDLLGWQTSTWALVLDPTALAALGYEVVLTAK
jgi:hypothetical protein